MPFFPSDFNKQAQRAGKNIDAPVNEGGLTLLHVSAQNGDNTAVTRLLKLGANPLQRDINGQTPLYAALAARNLDAVKLLLEAGARFNDEDDAATTPLHWAIGRKADAAFLEQLRALGAAIETPDSKGRTALQAAAAANNTDVIAWLLKSRALIDAPDAAGKTALHKAIENGAHEAIKLLLEAGANPLLRTSEIKTPLYLAAEKGDSAAVDLLLERSEVQHTLNENDWRSYKEGFSPLMVAVANGHVDVAERLIDVGAYVNEKDNKNRHSLFIAAESGTPDMMRMLIRRGADVAKAPLHSDGQTILHKVGAVNYKEKLLLLIEAGADINAVDGFGASALNLSAEACDFPKVRTLLELGANPNHANGAGRRPLDRAMELPTYNDEAFKIVTALLGAGASPDIAPSESVPNSPLHVAARSGNVRAVKLLLSHGASVDVADRYMGTTPWLLAAGAPSYEICELLRDRGANTAVKDKSNRNVLHYAARSGEFRLLTAALNDPAFKGQIDAPDVLGLTPLVEAIRNYKTDCARLLLNAGADPLAYDIEGQTPVHHLVRFGTDTMFPLFASVLAKKGCDWNVPTKFGKLTPLHIAARDGLSSGLDFLLRQNVDITVQDSRGQTPLMTAVTSERTWIVRALIDEMRRKKIPLDAARDNGGLTALHLAVSATYGALQNATMLLEGGANINLTTPAGDTPLHIAVARGRTDLVQLLLGRGADLTQANTAGATPLDLARATNKQDIIALLQEALKQKKLAQQMPPPRFSNRPRPPAP